MALYVSYSLLLGRIAKKLNLDVNPKFSLYKTPDVFPLQVLGSL